MIKITKMEVNEFDNTVILHHARGLSISSFRVHSLDGSHQSYVDSWVDEDMSIYGLVTPEMAYSCKGGKWVTIYTRSGDV